MAGVIREARLGSATARSKLKPGRMAHWNTVRAGYDALGYQRKPGDKTGRWLLRRRRGGSYSVEPLGAADDDRKPDGVSVLSFEQARHKAVELSASAENRPAGRLTVKRAMADYLDFLSAQGKATRVAESAAVAYILPTLANLEVAALTSAQLQRWLGKIATTPAQIRKPGDDGEETTRARRSTANRMLTVLKAALNHAFDNKAVPSNDAWGRRLKPFRGVTHARVRYLQVAEAVRLINAADPSFRPLVRAGLESGCRWSELARMQVADFNPDAGTLAVRRSKSGKPRHVILTDGGATFFAQVCAGKAGSDLMFPNGRGTPWSAATRHRYMTLACQHAKIKPAVSFHILRHTWASLAVMAGMPLMVVARNLGHVDTRMVEMHYSHLADSFVVDAVRSTAPRFDTGETSNVKMMKSMKKK